MIGDILMKTEKDDFDTPLSTQSKELLSLYSKYLSQIGRSNATITSYLSNLKLFSGS
jgi:hypothetical protein